MNISHARSIPMEMRQMNHYEAFKKDFPSIKVRQGSDFKGDIDCLIWIQDLKFNDYRKVKNWLKKRQLFLEPYDSETYMVYKD